MKVLKSISEDTPLIPEIIADKFADSAGEHEWLCNKAETHYKESEHFRKSITKSGNAGRDNLYMWMAHWHLSFINPKKNTHNGTYIQLD